MVLRPMQRAIAVAVLTVVALGAVACGGDDEPVEPDPTATEAAAPVIETATPFPVLPTTTIVELPTATATSTATATAATGGSHTVVAGDTLSQLAGTYGTTVSAIQAANDLEGTIIFVGQELVIPAAGEAPATATATTNSGENQVYIVQAGDSGSAIAVEFDITLEQLAAANGMSVDQLGILSVGQELLIPSP